MTRAGVIERNVRRRERRLERTGKWGTPRMRSRLKRLAERTKRECLRLGLPRYSPERSAFWGIDRSVMQPEDFTPAMRAALQE